jgi:hypothetical protein
MRLARFQPGVAIRLEQAGARFEEPGADRSGMALGNGEFGIPLAGSTGCAEAELTGLAWHGSPPIAQLSQVCLYICRKCLAIEMRSAE